MTVSYGSKAAALSMGPNRAITTHRRILRIMKHLECVLNREEAEKRRGNIEDNSLRLGVGTGGLYSILIDFSSASGFCVQQVEP